MTHTLKRFCVSIWLLCFLAGWHNPAYPESTPEHSRSISLEWGKAGDAAPAALYPVYFFKRFLSSADNDRCPMHPSCSSYCITAVKKHGAILGWIMTCDRLIRCGRDELKQSPSIRVNGQKRCHDPVSNNDFWWQPQSR